MVLFVVAAVTGAGLGRVFFIIVSFDYDYKYFFMIIGFL